MLNIPFKKSQRGFRMPQIASSTAFIEGFFMKSTMSKSQTNFIRAKAIIIRIRVFINPLLFLLLSIFFIVLLIIS